MTNRTVNQKQAEKERIKILERTDYQEQLILGKNGISLISRTTTTTQTLDCGPQIAALAEQVKDLKDTVNILISQIQMLGSEVRQKK